MPGGCIQGRQRDCRVHQLPSRDILERLCSDHDGDLQRMPIQYCCDCLSCYCPGGLSVYCRLRGKHSCTRVFARARPLSSFILLSGALSPKCVRALSLSPPLPPSISERFLTVNRCRARQGVLAANANRGHSRTPTAQPPVHFVWPASTTMNLGHHQPPRACPAHLTRIRRQAVN